MRAFRRVYGSTPDAYTMQTNHPQKVHPAAFGGKMVENAESAKQAPLPQPVPLCTGVVVGFKSRHRPLALGRPSGWQAPSIWGTPIPK